MYVVPCLYNNLFLFTWQNISKDKSFLTSYHILMTCFGQWHVLIQMFSFKNLKTFLFTFLCCPSGKVKKIQSKHLLRSVNGESHTWLNIHGRILGNNLVTSKWGLNLSYQQQTRGQLTYPHDSSRWRSPAHFKQTVQRGRWVVSWKERALLQYVRMTVCKNDNSYLNII